MNQDPIFASIDAFAEQNREAILRDITRLVAVPSVQGEPAPGAPFGPGPRRALDTALAIAAELGLDTHNAEGYIGWAETGPVAEGQKYLATITHCDVVPEGNGWDADPYTVRVRDGWLLGRGVADDKGRPSSRCMRSNISRTSGARLRYPVRALLGTNEETNMHDVDYYAEHFAQPAFCFTPDAEFPVCNGEKGGFNGEIVSPRLEGGVIADFGGRRGCQRRARPRPLRRACAGGVAAPGAGLSFHEEDGLTVIEAHGKSGHAATPEGTVNAIGLVVSCLLDSGVTTPAETAYCRCWPNSLPPPTARRSGIAADDGLFTPLTIIGGTMKMDNGRLRQSFDCRYPTNTDAAALTANMTAACGSAAKLENVSSRVPFYIDANSPAIRTLIDTYNDVTGEQATPFTMGGGTYARHFPYAVSFGPEHADMQLPDFAGRCTARTRARS